MVKRNNLELFTNASSVNCGELRELGHCFDTNDIDECDSSYMDGYDNLQFTCGWNRIGSRCEPNMSEPCNGTGNSGSRGSGNTRDRDRGRGEGRGEGRGRGGGTPDEPDNGWSWWVWLLIVIIVGGILYLFWQMSQSGNESGKVGVPVEGKVGVPVEVKAK